MKEKITIMFAKNFDNYRRFLKSAKLKRFDYVAEGNLRNQKLYLAFYQNDMKSVLGILNELRLTYQIKPLELFDYYSYENKYRINNN